MSILNPSMNKMIAELVAMPPQQLAQYAAANQNDTMKFLAAKAASDMQKKQMAAGAAQQPQAAAPPVAQQVVQQMAQGLPEETGIGALPVPEMKHMAAGGIVAFAEGGINDAMAAVNASMPDPRVDPSGFERFGGSMTDYLAARQKALQAVKYNMTPENPESAQAYESTYGTSYQSGPHARPARVPTPSVATMPTENTRRTDSRFPSGVAALTPVSAPVGQRGGPTPASSGATLTPGAGISALASGATPSTTTDFQKLYEGMMPKEPVADPFAAEHAESAADRKRVAEKGVEVAKEREAGLAGLLAPKEQRIKDKEARQQKTDDNNLNMSLINAGLAMMQSTGKGLAGLAEGATAGVKQYSEGLKLSEAARQKIEDAKDAFDELKFNQTNMSKKEIADAEAKIAEGAIVSRNEGINARVAATGEKRADAKEVFGALKDQIMEKDRQRFQAQQDRLKMDNTLKAAGISANAGTAAKIDMLEKLGAADPKSPLYRGYIMTVQEDKEPKMYAEYQKMAFDPTQGEEFKKRYPTFELYKAGMSGGGGFMKSTGSAAGIERAR